MRVERCKGTRDLSPDEMTKFRLIEGVFSDCCLKGGYREIRTPTLEYLHLFTSTGTLTPGTLGKVYSFLDWDGWSGERVVLRPDATIPVARSYIDTVQNGGLTKLFYVTNIFIFEETGKETRERWQCGAELIGAGSTMADVELITLALDILKKLGLKKVELQLSHAGLIRALLAEFGLTPQEQASVFDQILDGDEAVFTKLKAKTPELGETLAPLLDPKGQSAGFLRNLKALFRRDLPEFEPALDNFIDIVDLMEALGYSYQIDIASGRGFEYYTGVIFQLFAGKERVAGGGRYDALIPLMGGREVPASGFALYLDPLIGLIKPEVIDGQLPERILIRVGDSTLETVKEGFSIATYLRDAGYAAEMNLGSQPPADIRWILDVKNEAPRFVVTDTATKKESQARTAKEVLALLGGNGDS
ncbi:MAG: ATP phosphoribosyltransferase regulatory subunit [Dehalococcoidales bacterium]|nr:MAG: ATP phosphoribosyltransferase regulatory subunit [Dehalococcoidales bacterium]